MRTGHHFTGDQAEIVFGDVLVECLEDLPARDREEVLAEVVGLCEHPVGTHPLSNRSASDSLAGWNTLGVLDGEHRVVFASRIVDGRRTDRCRAVLPRTGKPCVRKTGHPGPHRSTA